MDGLPIMDAPSWEFQIQSGYESPDEEDEPFPGITQRDARPSTPVDPTHKLGHLPLFGPISVGVGDDNTVKSCARPSAQKNYSPQLSDDDVDPGAHDRTFDSVTVPKRRPKLGSQLLGYQKTSKRFSSEEPDEYPIQKRPRDSMFGGDAMDLEPAHGGEAKYFVHRAQSKKGSEAMISFNYSDNETDCEDQSSARLSALHLQDRVSPKQPRIRRNFGLGISDDEDHDGFGKRVSPTPSDGMDELGRRSLGVEERIAYELRTNVKRNVISTWRDQDRSGNYDPEAERKKAQLKRVQAREKKKKGKRKQKEKVAKLIVHLRFPKEITTVLNITDAEENWPDHWSEIDSEEELALQKRREEFRKKTRIPNREAQSPIKDPLNEIDDLTGYPLARGCVSCRERNRGDCSLITGGTWPCAQCQNDECGCELIVPPRVRDHCQRCVNIEVPCSFTDKDAPYSDAICDRCLDDHAFDCFPPPKEGSKAPRIDLDEIMYGPKRKHVHCTYCRANNKRCSVKKQSDRGPCNRCKKAKIGCTFYDLPPTVASPEKPTKNKKGKKDKPTNPDPNEASGIPSSPFLPATALWDLKDDEPTPPPSPSSQACPAVELEDAEGRKGITTSLRTSFSHPINFHVTSADEPVSCNFCQMPAFGMMGYGEQNVYVLQWYNGLGYTELGGGHCEHQGATEMCQPCTLGRLQIHCCDEHTIVPLDAGEGNLDSDALAEELMRAMNDPAQTRCELQRWCSMCMTPATYRCGTEQPAIHGDEEALVDGCGLRLCTLCAERLVGEFEGSASDMARVVDGEPKPRGRGNEGGTRLARADVGFLVKDGLLMRNLEVYMVELEGEQV